VSSGEANPLGLSLGFIEGMALVSLRDHAVTAGLTIRALDLELLDVTFPLDLEGGAEEFQRRSTRLRTLVVELEVATFARELERGLALSQSPLKNVQLRAENGALALEAELVLQDRRARLLGQLVLAPSEPREVKLVLSDVLELGYFPLSTLSLPDQLEAAFRVLLEPFGERCVETLHRSGAGSIALDAVGALFFALFPRHGWKLPQHEDVPIQRLFVKEQLIRLELGDLSSIASTNDGAKAPETVLRAMAKDDAGGIAASAEKLLLAGDVVGAFSEMRAKLDPSGGPEVLMERLLSLGTADPRLFADAGDLANDQLRRRKDSVTAMAAKARIAMYQGDARAAYELFEKIAKILREQAKRRHAGHAFIAASRAAKRESPERARVLEEAIALLPDDVEALSGLVEELPSLGRASAAVRAARRLASLADTADMRVRSHTIAGDLLRGPLADPVQAKREYERALKIAPDDELALEGLARAVTDGGEPRRAATLFEKLIARAEAEHDSPRASRLSMMLGELWRPLDAEAAMVRFRRAHELDPKNLAALSKLAQAASEAGRTEAALDALERALPMVAGDDAPELLDLRLRAGALLAKEPDRAAEAIGHYESALRIDPKNIEAGAALRDLYERTGEQTKLGPLLSRYANALVEANQLELAALRYRELALWSSRDRTGLAVVRAAIGVALVRDRKSRALLDALVDVSELEGDANIIVEAIDRRLLLDDEAPVRASLLERFGGALERANRVSDAVRAYEEAVLRHPFSVRAIEALVRIYRDKEDHERLAAALDRAAAIATDSPDRAAFLGERAKILAALGRDADAFESIQRAIEEAPEDQELLPVATHLAIRTGRFAEARIYATKRLAAEEDGPAELRMSIHLDLARAAEGAGDRDSLIVELERAHALAEPGGENARAVAARLVRELHLANRFEALAELHRRLAEAPSTSIAERAERWIEASRLAAKVGKKQIADDDARRALAVLDASKPAIGTLLGEASLPAATSQSWPADFKAKKAQLELETQALDLLEGLVREEGNARQLAEVLGRRARSAEVAGKKEKLRLEQAKVLEDAALDVLAVQALEEAADELPSSIDIARALGEAAERANQLTVTASSFGRAAKLAEAVGHEEMAIEMHGRAAQACTALGDVAFAVSHDRALLSLCPPGNTSPWLGKAIDRLEKYARQEADHLLLVEVLSRRAATAAPSFAARLFLEKATIEAELLSNDRASLDSLKRARALAQEGSEAADSIEDRLTATYARLQMYSEQAMVLVERAERAKTPEKQSSFYYDAARVYSGPLGDRGLALSRAQAAIRAFSGNEAARALRLRLLRDGGRKEALVDALEDEASMSSDANEAARLWVEAADILLPTAKLADEEAAQRPNKVDLERGVSLVRRAAAAAPRAPQPLRAAALYTRMLGRADEELVALEHLVEREIPDEERVASCLRRVELLRGPLEDASAAEQELDVALVLIDEMREEARAAVIEYLPSRTAIAFELLTRPLLAGVLRAGIELAANCSNWANHVRLLLKLVDISEETKQRADLRTSAGEVLEWKLGDGAAAEREYRAALALDPHHERARDALKSFYVGSDRFSELAENLGADVLAAVWKKLRLSEAPQRVLAVGAALWPILPESSAERAEVQLELADLLTTARDDTAQAIELLEQVAQVAPNDHQARALERLKVLFLEEQRFEEYVGVLRRQSERIDNDRARARAIADLGEALEWKLGDGAAAEREYRAAIAIDAECTEARERLAVFLASQDRFDELGRDLGAQVLAEELDRLVKAGEREEERAWKAATALADLVDRPATMWLRFADRAKGGPNERPALERAADEAGPEQARALDRLIALLETQGDSPALANVMRRRVTIENEPEARLQLHFRLGSLLFEMIEGTDAASREVLITEAERELRAGLLLDPGHVGVRLLLESIYVIEGRLVDVGRVLGVDTLRAVRARAEEHQSLGLLERAIDALADLSEGEERAQHLVQLVELTTDRDALKKWTPESLYQAALVAHPGNFPAREGLRALYEAEGRYKDIAQVLGTDALRETLEQLRRLEDQTALLPASLALAHALSANEGTEGERAELLAQIAELQFREGDVEAGEHALRTALELVPSHPVARRELRVLFTRQERLAELAELDESLVTEAAQDASARADLGVEIIALTVLASRREGAARADTLVLVASLEQRRNDDAAAEEALRSAMMAAPQHAMARAELEALLWSKQRYADLLRALGAATLLARAKNAAESEDREAARNAVAGLLNEQELDAALAAEAYELSASLNADGEAKLLELSRARVLWDELLDNSGRERVRLAIAAVHRQQNNSVALIDALADASEVAGSKETRAKLIVERAELLLAAQRREEAQELARKLVGENDAPKKELRAAARMLIDELAEDELDLRVRALELLAEDPAALDRWLIALSEAREEQGLDGAPFTEPLERALLVLNDRSQENTLRRKLRESYEQTGDWRRAEGHASVIAEAENRPESWVALSELRQWLDDPAGVRTALERALEVDPAAQAAHEALVRLAEREGDHQTMIARLSTWAKEDRTAPKRERAERLLRAARLAADDGDGERAAEHAERAFELLDHHEEDVPALAWEACAILEPLGKRESMAVILGRAVGLSSRTADLRIRLADLLVSLGREIEAGTVVEQGIQRLTPEDDPLVARFLSEMAALPDDTASRRLLALADKLGSGPVARKLRLEGAERAELSGQNTIAANAWSTIAAEVGAGAEAALAKKSLLRLARITDDQTSLVTALVSAAEDEVSPRERASLLGEAADRADRSLHDAERAEALLRRAIAADPTNDWLRDRLLELFGEHHRFAALDEELSLRAEMKSGAEKAAFYDKQGENALRSLRDHHRAALAYGRAYEAEPAFVRAIAAARASLFAGEHRAAADWAQRAENEHAVAPRAIFDARLLRAEALEAAQDIDRAVEALLEAKAAMPDLELAETRLLDLLARHARWRDLAGALDGFAERADSALGIRSRLSAARIYLDELGDKEAAFAVLQGALRLADRWLNDPEVTVPDQLARDPSSPLLDLAATALELGAHALRIDALRLRVQSLPIGPEQWRALIVLAAAEREANDLAASEATLRGVVEDVRKDAGVSPADRAEAELALGQLLLDRQDADGAAEAFARAVEHSRAGDVETAAQEIRALVQRAAAEKARGQNERALAALLEAHALDATSVAEIELEAAIEAAGPSKRLAELNERRAARVDHAPTAARHERAAAKIYAEIGERARALEPQLRALRLDPSKREEALDLTEKLYRAERHAELAQVLALRLEVEDLTDAERVSLLLSRAELLARRLDKGREALGALYEARELHPKSREVLSAIADLASRLELDDVRADSLLRLVAVERSLERKQKLLSERAQLLERGGDLAGAAQALEEAVDVALQRAKEASLSGETLPVPRVLVERLAALYATRGHFASAARLWVRVADAASGNQAAAALSRAGHIRLEALGDRRGAMAAFEAAARQSPGDLGIRRALLDLANVLGDVQKTRAHARAGIEAAKNAGEKEALFAFTLEDARNSAKMQDRVNSRMAWESLLELSPEHPRLLDHLSAFAREANATEELAKLLKEKQLAAQETETTADLEDEYRVQRTNLDREGRFAELASLEERRAAALTDPVARSTALVEAGRLHAEKNVDDPSRARDAFVRAVRAFPDNVDALARLAKLEIDLGAHERAAPVFDRLERLGGPPWPVPAFELLGASVAHVLGLHGLEKVRLLRARERDPASVEALSRLAHLSEGEGWLDAYETTIDRVTAPDELASVYELRARLYERSGSSNEAFAAISQAIELDPVRDSALALRRLMLEASPPSRALVDVLIEDAGTKDRESALATLIYALGIAENIGDVTRMLDLASRIEGLASPNDAVWPRLVAIVSAHGDGEALLRIADRLGGIAKLGELPDQAKIRLARAALAQGRAYDTVTLFVSFLPDLPRFSEIAARVLGDVEEIVETPERVLRSPHAMARLRSLLLQLGRDGNELRAQLVLLDALVTLLPRERSLARRLARAHSENKERLPQAMDILRRLLDEDPLDAELVLDLANVASRLEDRAALAGPDMVANLFTGEGQYEHGPLSIDESLLRDEVRHAETKTPLGELLRLTARAVCGVLPPPQLAERVRAEDDPRLADLAAEVLAMFDMSIAAAIDPGGGHRVILEPGEPPTIVIGEALVEDATAPELRFHLARAAALLELGYAIVEHTAGTGRRQMIEMIVAACDPEATVRVTPELGDAIDRVREKLGPTGLAVCEPLATAVKNADVPIAGWMYGAVTTANRLALLAAGDLRAAILALRRSDPRSLGERFDTKEARLRALKRSSALTDLLRFTLSESFERLMRGHGRVGAGPTERFRSES
jgi:tetratricopeptide (TPR) repeat protein